MPDHTINIHQNGAAWKITNHKEPHVKAKHTIEWQAHPAGHQVVVHFVDNIVGVQQVAVPPGTATVRDNPAIGDHAYHVTVDGQPVDETRSAPGIIIE
jgi:hypothetical protein